MAKGKYQEWLEPEGLLKIEGWARDGLTDEQIAANMGIAAATLYNWKNAHVEIVESLKKGKEVVDRQVENALLKRALGYEYEEISEKYELGVLTERKVTKKQIVPDTTAQIFWLKNRKPEYWRDKREVGISGKIETDPYDELSLEELRALAKKCEEDGNTT